MPSWAYAYAVDRCIESPYSWPRHSWVPFALILGPISIRPNYPQTNHNVENTYTPQQRIVCFSIVDTRLPFMPIFLCFTSHPFLECGAGIVGSFTISSDFHILNLTQWTNKFQCSMKWQSNQREFLKLNLWLFFISSEFHTCTLTMFVEITDF